MRLRSAVRGARSVDFPRFRRSAAIAGLLAAVSSAAAVIGLSLGAGGVRHDGRQPALVLAGSTVVCTNLARNIEGAYLIEGAATVCDCLADLTGDGAVNGADLGIALNAWGIADALGTGDVNHDGLVNGVDLGIMLSAWGACH